MSARRRSAARRCGATPGYWGCSWDCSLSNGVGDGRSGWPRRCCEDDGMDGDQVHIRQSRLAILVWLIASAVAAQDDAANDESDGKARLRRAQEFAAQFDVRLAITGEAVARIEQ